MPKGKRPARFRGQHRLLDHKPSVAIIGHSMPRRVFDHFDSLMLGDNYGLDIARGVKTPGQVYAEYLNFSRTFEEINFYPCSKILSHEYLHQISAIGNHGHDFVISHLGSNDLAPAYASEQLIANAMFSSARLYQERFNIDHVLFVTELKRTDTPDDLGQGNLHCSVEDFETRVKKFNSLVKAECDIVLEYEQVTFPGFWYDDKHNEIPVAQWSTDRLHPGPDPDHPGFQKYVRGLRNAISDGLAQTCHIKMRKDLL